MTNAPQDLGKAPRELGNMGFLDLWIFGPRTFNTFLGADKGLLIFYSEWRLKRAGTTYSERTISKESTLATPGVNRWVEEELQSTDNQAGRIRGYENCGANLQKPRE